MQWFFDQNGRVMIRELKHLRIQSYDVIYKLSCTNVG